jgi:hypothetical protein
MSFRHVLQGFPTEVCQFVPNEIGAFAERPGMNSLAIFFHVSEALIKERDTYATVQCTLTSSWCSRKDKSIYCISEMKGGSCRL